MRENTWTIPDQVYRIKAGDWVLVDACNVLVGMAKTVACYRQLQRPFPVAPRAAVRAKLDKWWGRFRFEDDNNIVVFCIDSRTNPLKCRDDRARQRAKDILRLAREATEDTAHFQGLHPDEWEKELENLDKAQKTVASYGPVLIALVREWAVQRGHASRLHFVFAPFEADPQMVAMQKQGLGTRIMSEDSDMGHRGSRLQLTVANDQRSKAVRYLKGGHIDMASLHVHRNSSGCSSTGAASAAAGPSTSLGGGRGGGGVVVVVVMVEVVMVVVVVAVVVVAGGPLLLPVLLLQLPVAQLQLQLPALLRSASSYWRQRRWSRRASPTSTGRAYALRWMTARRCAGCRLPTRPANVSSTATCAHTSLRWSVPWHLWAPWHAGCVGVETASSPWQRLWRERQSR
jgi:hypothetical protein